MDAPFLLTAPEARRRGSQGQARSAPPLDSNLQNPAAPRPGAPGALRSRVCTESPPALRRVPFAVCVSIRRSGRPLWVVLPAPLPGRLVFMASPGAARFALALGYPPSAPPAQSLPRQFHLARRTVSGFLTLDFEILGPPITLLLKRYQYTSGDD